MGENCRRPNLWLSACDLRLTIGLAVDIGACEFFGKMLSKYFNRFRKIRRKKSTLLGCVSFSVNGVVSFSKFLSFPAMYFT